MQHALWEKMREDNREITQKGMVFYDIEEFSDDNDDDDDDNDNKNNNDTDNSTYENQNNFEKE